MYVTKSIACWNLESAGIQDSCPLGGSIHDKIVSAVATGIPPQYHTSSQSQDILNSTGFCFLQRRSAGQWQICQIEIIKPLLRNTFKASSNLSCTMLVQVRCNSVSIPYSDCVSPARSKLLSCVDPPAPQVTLMPNGPRAFNREIRGSRFAKP